MTANIKWTTNALVAFAHKTRLSVFRMSVQAGADGVIAGAIAERCVAPPFIMSHHLATMERAGLVQSERQSRLIYYRADYAAMRRRGSTLIRNTNFGLETRD